MSKASFELRTSDVGSVRDRIATLMGPFRLTASGAGPEARVRHDRVGPLSFLTIAYGQPIEIAAHEMRHGMALQRAMVGSIAARSAGRELLVSGLGTQVVPGDGRLRMRCSADCRMLVISIARDDLAAQVAALAGDELDLPSALPPLLSLAGPWAGLGRCIDYLYLESRRPDGALAGEAAGRAAAQMLFSHLIRSVDGRPRPGRAGYVKRAEDFMLANLGDSIALGDLVASAQVCVRTLYHGFTAHHGVPPMTWLRQQRLERIRAELASAAPGETTVSEVAMRWGCTHLGRFAAQYRARFGESPSRTLDRG